MASTSTPSYKKYDYSGAYQQAQEQIKAAEDAAYQATKAELDQQAGKLGVQYDKLRGDIYKNARVSAIGNNEMLAAKGLAGGLYDTAKSGVSETSRISQDNTLRTNLANASLQEQQERDGIAQQIISLGYTRDKNIADRMADLILWKNEGDAGENQYEASYNYNAWNAAQQAEMAQRQLALEKANAELATFGKVMTKETAQTLGVPIGTSSFAAQQAMTSGRSGRTGGGGGDSSGYDIVAAELEKTRLTRIPGGQEKISKNAKMRTQLDSAVKSGLITKSERAKLESKYMLKNTTGSYY